MKRHVAMTLPSVCLCVGSLLTSSFSACDPRPSPSPSLESLLLMISANILQATITHI